MQKQRTERPAGSSYASQNPLLRIWGWGKDEHGRLIGAVISALIAVVLGMMPYFAAAQVIIGMLAGEKDLSFYLPWLGLGLAGYAARTLLYNMALSMSHKATFSILKSIRKKILEKLPKLPLGTVMDMSSGKMKQIIVDQVDGMETTLAHLFPELTANIAGPLFIVVWLFHRACLTDHDSSGGLALVQEWKPVGGNLYHGHHPVPRHCGAAHCRDELCRHACYSRHNGGICG